MFIVFWWQCAREHAGVSSVIALAMFGSFRAPSLAASAMHWHITRPYLWSFKVHQFFKLLVSTKSA